MEDDGRGFDHHGRHRKKRGGDARSSLGLIIMRERAMLAGGDLKVESKPGKGTLVIAEIPIGDQAGAFGL